MTFKRIALNALAIVVTGAWVYAGFLPWRSEMLAERVLQEDLTFEEITSVPLAEKPARFAAWKILLEGGDLEEADRLAQHAIKNRPLYADSWADRAEIAFRRGDPEAARKFARTARELWPVRPHLLWRLAMLDTRMGDTQLALGIMSDYLRSAPRETSKVFTIARRLESDPDSMADAVLPKSVPKRIRESYYHERLIDYARRIQSLELADAAWRRLPGSAR